MVEVLILFRGLSLVGKISQTQPTLMWWLFFLKSLEGFLYPLGEIPDLKEVNLTLSTHLHPAPPRWPAVWVWLFHGPLVTSQKSMKAMCKAGMMVEPRFLQNVVPPRPRVWSEKFMSCWVPQQPPWYQAGLLVSDRVCGFPPAFLGHTCSW
jgi:hypothetical protein